jgi:hypothetical protein
MSIRRRTWTTQNGETRSSWVVDYRDRDGQRHITSFEHKKDAAAYDAEVQVAVRAGTHTAPSRSPTIAEAIADWLERGELEQLERATLKQYRELGTHIEQHLSTTRLAHLTNPRREHIPRQPVPDHVPVNGAQDPDRAQGGPQ